MSVRRCLFVNDSAFLLEQWHMIFADNPNVLFAECHSVEDGLNAILKEQPDVVLLDHHLTPDGNEGFKIIDRVHGPKFYTTTADSSVIPLYKNLGIEPVEIKALFSIIEGI